MSSPLHGLARALHNAADSQKSQGNNGKAAGLKVAAAVTHFLSLLHR